MTPVLSCLLQKNSSELTFALAAQLTDQPFLTPVYYETPRLWASLHRSDLFEATKTQISLSEKVRHTTCT